MENSSLFPSHLTNKILSDNERFSFLFRLLICIPILSENNFTISRPSDILKYHIFFQNTCPNFYISVIVNRDLNFWLKSK